MQDRFWQVEEEYLRLRDQFAGGLISAEEFDAALQNLQVEDAEGRVWMLGANTGRWYYTTSPHWVEGDPVHSSPSPDETAMADPPDLPDETNSLVPDTAPVDVRRELISAPAPWKRRIAFVSREFALFLCGIGAALLLAALIFLNVFNSESPLFASADSNPTPTRIVPRVAVSAPTTDTPIQPTPTSTRRVELFRTPVPITPTRALVIAPTSSDPVLTIIPTITPNVNPDRRGTTEPLSSMPPAVYVTNIRVAPNPPHRLEPITFTASFWNTNRESVPMNWRLILVDPYRQGRNKDFGESPFAGITVPPGRTEFSITYSPVNSGGPCVPLQVLAARRRDDNSRVFLLGTNGTPFAVFITFC